MRKITFLILSMAIFCLCGNKLIAQRVNGNFNFSMADDYLLRIKAQQHPEVIEKYIMYEENLRELIAASNNSNPKSIQTDTLINGRKIIPVVFHIVHNYGPENINDQQIKDAVALLNNDYNKLNSDTTPSFSWPAFSSRRANLHLEFRLAKIDPNGNYTDGIQRHHDERTNFAYYDLNHDYSWNPKMYLNIYSVGYIYPAGMSIPDGAQIGGMSVFPPSNPLTAMFTGGDTLADGVLIRHDGIGSIGTATSLMGMGINALNRTFTHELGHYFNLYHPFQNLKLVLSTIPVMGATGCSTTGTGLFAFTTLNGDEVNDTPPISAASQNTSTACFVPGVRNTCNNNVSGFGDEVDMVENYMDYQLGYCTNIFTNGQKTRMDVTMNTDRHQLWTKENLIATGVLDTSFNPISVPRSDFTVDLSNGYNNSNTEKIMVCMGKTVSFIEYSYNGTPNTWEWSFPGGTPTFSTDIHPIVKYDVPGVYPVKLKVSNSAGSDSLTRDNLIYVSDPAIAISNNVLEGFETLDLTNNNSWVVFNQDNKNSWEITDTATYAGSKCLRMLNFANNSAGSIDEIVTPSYNFSTMTPQSPFRIKFKLSYAAKKVPNNALAAAIYGTNTADTLYDKLSVYYSLDCGSSWIQRYTKSGFGLVTAGLDSNGFAPTLPTQWREENFVVVPSVAQNHNVRLKFIFKSGGANNLYIDNLQIGDLNTGLTNEERTDNLDFTFYPNPMTDQSVISFNVLEPENVSVDIYDVLGKKITNIVNSNLNTGNHSFEISKEKFNSAGVYFVKIKMGEQLITRRIMVQ